MGFNFKGKPLPIQMKTEWEGIKKIWEKMLASSGELGIAEVIGAGATTNKFLALHRTAPVGTLIKVTNQANGQSVWATYYGGVSEGTPKCTSDQFGNIYLGGSTSETFQISTTGSFQESFNGSVDMYLAKFDRLHFCKRDRRRRSGSPSA